MEESWGLQNKGSKSSSRWCWYWDSLELKALCTFEGETPLQKYSSHKISFNTEFHGAFRTKEVCTCLPHKTWPSVLTQVLSKLLLGRSLTSESPITLLPSRSWLLKMQSSWCSSIQEACYQCRIRLLPKATYRIWIFTRSQVMHMLTRVS